MCYISYQNSTLIKCSNVFDKVISVLDIVMFSVGWHFSYVLFVENLYEFLKVKNITTIFKVPEETKKIVVEEKVHVPEEPKFPPAKGIAFADWPLM